MNNMTLTLSLLIPLITTIGIYLSLRGYFDNVVSNSFSSQDYQRVLLTLLIGAFGIWGPMLLFWKVQNISSMIAWLLALIVFAFIGTEIIRFFKHVQTTPFGSWVERSFPVRYWPSYIVRKREVVLGQTTVLSFKLIQSEFDFSLTMLSNDAESLASSGAFTTLSLDEIAHEDKQKLLQKYFIPFPLPKHDEEAITQSGPFRDDNATIRIACDAPDFEPSYREVKTTIKALLQNDISFPLTPKSHGSKHIVFRLLDVDDVAKAAITVDCKVVEKRNRLLSIVPQTIASLSVLLALINTFLIILEKLKILP